MPALIWYRSPIKAQPLLLPCDFSSVFTGIRMPFKFLIYAIIERGIPEQLAH